MSRLEKAPDHVFNLAEEVKGRRFPDLAEAQVFCFFDKQKRKQGGAYTGSNIVSATSVVNALVDGDWDFVLTLDKTFFGSLSVEDKDKLITFELSRCTVTVANEETKYSVAAYDFKTTALFATLEPDWMAWQQRMANHIAQIHEAAEPVGSGQESILDPKRIDRSSAYYHETEETLSLLIVERELGPLPADFDGRDDQARMDWLVNVLEGADAQRKKTEAEADAG